MFFKFKTNALTKGTPHTLRVIAQFFILKASIKPRGSVITIMTHFQALTMRDGERTPISLGKTMKMVLQINLDSKIIIMRVSQVSPNFRGKITIILTPEITTIVIKVTTKTLVVIILITDWGLHHLKSKCKI